MMPRACVLWETRGQKRLDETRDTDDGAKAAIYIGPAKKLRL
jgi:hypothetical protein